MDPTKDIPPFTNYVSYRDPQTQTLRIGHYDVTAKTIQPLCFSSGTPISTLYQVIEAGAVNTQSYGRPFPASFVKVLAPLPSRDVLCVGKNYAEHAREFNSSGFDSSDKVDQPSHPVIFTKRYTSIIADGDEIFPHPKFTQTADYEGEIGVIIGKVGYRVKEEEAMDYVWGYTIINDMTARERQRDHKQFYIGKSADTFCPMGPIAVPKEQLDQVLRVQTHVNGELRQDATTNDLIFPIPHLIKTMSEGQTLMPGDVLATGTPAGVGIGLKPPVYLSPGDTISISVPGLSTLTNRIASPTTPIPQAFHPAIQFSSTLSKWSNPNWLKQLNHKPLHYRRIGRSAGAPFVFIHGLGGTTESFIPLIHRLALHKKYNCHLFDLEGHGLSPTHPLSVLSIASFASDLAALFHHTGITHGATLIAYSPLGCAIATRFAVTHAGLAARLILVNPAAAPLKFYSTEALKEQLHALADTARTQGMSSVADLNGDMHDWENYSAALANDEYDPIALAARRLSLLSQDPEGYAKACSALADSLDEKPSYDRVEAQIVIVDGRNPPIFTNSTDLGHVAVKNIEYKHVSSWYGFENVREVAQAVEEGLKETEECIL